MAIQKFYASRNDAMYWPNGAIGYRPGGPFDCVGPFAKVRNCRVHETFLRLTVYATGYADTAFSIPAATQWRGKYIGGYLTTDEHFGGAVFRPTGKGCDRMEAARKDALMRIFAPSLGTRFDEIPVTEVAAWFCMFDPLGLIAQNSGAEWPACVWYSDRLKIMHSWRYAQFLHVEKLKGAV